MAKLTKIEKLEQKEKKRLDKQKAKEGKLKNKGKGKKGSSAFRVENNDLILGEDEVLDLFSSDRLTVRSLCSPDGVNPNPLGYLELNDGGKIFYVCNMYIDKLGTTSSFAETYAPLLNYPNTTSKIDIKPMTSNEATKMLDKRIVALDSELAAAEKAGDRNRYRKISQMMADCEGWAHDVESGKNSLFKVGFLFSIFSESIEKLNDSITSFYTLAREKGIDVVASYSMHPEVYVSNSPYADMEMIGSGIFKSNIIKYHPMDKYGLTTIFNHTQSNFSHKNGILAGRNLDTYRPVLVDPYDKSHDNYNILFCGLSGVGKSATIKMWTSRWMEIFYYKMAIIDFDSPNGMEGEYAPLVRAHDGAVFQIKHNTENVLNIFELDEELDWNKNTNQEERKLYLSAKVDDCTNIVLLMIKNGQETNDFETDIFLREIVSKGAMELYTEMGIREGDPDSLYVQDTVLRDGMLTAGMVKKTMPTLSALYLKLLKKQALNKSEFHEKAYAIAISGIETYVKDVIYSERTIQPISAEVYESLEQDRNGFRFMEINGVKEKIIRVRGFKPYFDGQSSVNFTSDTRAIDIDLSQLPESDRNIAQQVACSFINEKCIKKNSNNPNKLQKLIVLVDEFHRTFAYESARQFISALYRQARKRYVSMATVTQALTDYNSYDETRAIVKNSSMKILFKQDIMDTDFIHQVTPLTDAQISRVMSLGGTRGMSGQVDDKRKGELCLIDSNGQVVFVKVDYLVSSEARICETDPAKLAKMFGNKRRVS